MGRLTVIAATILAAAPATGDWLVTRDGARIETRGRWQVEGRGVVFTLPLNATLSVLRQEDVDLEASAALTASARSRPTTRAAGIEAVPGKPVLVLTNEDVAVPAAEDEADVEAEAEPEQPAEEPVEHDPVEVVSWATRERPGADGLEIHGTVRNTGTGTAADIRVKVTVLDTEETLVESRAFLGQTGLGPGGSTTFRALLAGVYDVPEDPSFSVRSDGFSILAPAPAGDAEGETEPGEPRGHASSDNVDGGHENAR